MDHLIRFSLLCDQLSQEEFEIFRNNFFASKQFFCDLLFEYHLNQLKLLPKISKISTIISNINKLNDFASKIIHLREKNKRNTTKCNNNFKPGSLQYPSCFTQLPRFGPYLSPSVFTASYKSDSAFTTSYKSDSAFTASYKSDSASTGSNISSSVLAAPSYSTIRMDTVLNDHTLSNEEFEMLRSELFSDTTALKSILMEYYLNKMKLAQTNNNNTDNLEINRINDDISDTMDKNKYDKFDITAGAFTTIIASFLDLSSIINFELSCRRIFVYIHNCCVELDYVSTTKCYKYCNRHHSVHYFARFRNVKKLQINAEKIVQNSGYNYITFDSLLPENGGNITNIDINAHGLSSISLFLKIFGHFHLFNDIKLFRFMTNEYIEFPLFDSIYHNFRDKLTYLQLDQFVNGFRKKKYVKLVANLRGMVYNSSNLSSLLTKTLYLNNIESYHHHCDYSYYSPQEIIINPKIKEFCCTFPHNFNMFNYKQWNDIKRFHFTVLRPIIVSERSAYWYNFIEIISKPSLEYISIHCQMGLFRVIFDAFTYMLKTPNYPGAGITTNPIISSPIQSNKSKSSELLSKLPSTSSESLLASSELLSSSKSSSELLLKLSSKSLSTSKSLKLSSELLSSSKSLKLSSTSSELLSKSKQPFMRPKLKFRLQIDCNLQNKETAIYLNNVLVKNLLQNMQRIAKHFMFIITINDTDAPSHIPYVPLTPWKKPFFRINSDYSTIFKIYQRTTNEQVQLIVSTHNYPDGYKENWLMSCDVCTATGGVSTLC